VGRLRRWQLRCFAFAFAFVGASLLAKAAWQPTHLSLKPLDPCGSWLASDSASTSNQYLPNTLSFIVGASLVAKRLVHSTDALNHQTLSRAASLSLQVG
jgi:hypothetical protein